jgi:hypothetical protein
MRREPRQIIARRPFNPAETLDYLRYARLSGRSAEGVQDCDLADDLVVESF